ncbi:signal peptidase I [Arthrobacter sp. TMN-50]
MGRIGAAPRWVIAAAFVGAAAVLGLRLTVLEPIIVTSDSMEPSVPRGSIVLLVKMTPSGEAGSLVAFDNPVDGALTLKRVVAIEGQTVAIRDAELYIDEIRSDEPFVDHESIDGTYYGPVTVPKGHVFVLGDNRATSIDSRDFGPIAVGQLTTSVVRFLPIGAP